jgi:hypothetical protein
LWEGAVAADFVEVDPVELGTWGIGWVPEETDADKDYSDDGGDEEVEDEDDHEDVVDGVGF